MTSLAPRGSLSCRRRLAVLAVAVLAAAFAAPGCRSAPVRPNVVLIVVDSLRADALGCYGAGNSVSPHIDTLASGGLRFERAIAQAGWNLPSLSSLVTSVYPSQHGQGVAGAAGETRTLAEVLSASGYRTGAFSEVSWALLQRGFDTFSNTAGVHLYGNPAASSAEPTFGAALDWIRTGGPKPFFALIHTYEVQSYFMAKPHAQAYARRENPSYQGRFLDWGIRDTDTPVGPRVIDALLAADVADLTYVKSLYRGALADVDSQVGRLLEALQQQKLDQNTLVIITSTNGEGFRPDLKRVHHGGRLHDDQLHVPLIVSWPGRVSPGVVRSLAESIDVAPTVLAAAGLAPEASFKGRSLLVPSTGLWARLTGVRLDPSSDIKTTALAEESALRVTATGRREASTLRQRALYSGWVALIDAGDHVELYDLKADPDEERDLSAGHPEAVAALGADLAQQAAGVALAKGAGSEVNDQLRSLGYVQ
jgi:arylsulfatase A-like enzyme